MKSSQAKLFIALLLLLSSSLFAQTISEPDLENWTQKGTSPNLWEDPATNFWGTLNGLVALPSTLGGPGPVTCEKVTDAYHGLYAAKLMSKQFYAIFIPGLMGTSTLDIPGSTIHLGRPWTLRPDRFSGYYKYAPVNGDSAAIVIMMSKWNPALNAKDTLGFGKMQITATVSTYTPFDVNVNWYDTITQPDSITLLTVSSAGFNMQNLQGGVGQVNSALWIDYVSLHTFAGIETFLSPEIKVSTYPNPAQNTLWLEMSAKYENAMIQIYTPDGKLISRQAIHQAKTEINTAALPKGSYYYKITSKGFTEYTGSFIKN